MQGEEGMRESLLLPLVHPAANQVFACKKLSLESFFIVRIAYQHLFKAYK